MQDLNSKNNAVDKPNSLLDFIQKFFKIIYKTKNDSGSKLGSFILNEPQLKLYNLIKKMIDEGRPVRIVILKARQMGFSTLVEAIIFALTITHKHVRSGCVAHNDKATQNILRIFKTYYNNLPKELKPTIMTDNTEQMVFDNSTKTGLDSSIMSMTATPNGIGRSFTFDYIHLSEYAFWVCDKNQAFSDLMQCVPSSKDSVVIIESTANGFDDFKDKFDKAVRHENDFEALFIGWHEMKEYRRKYYGFTLTKEEEELMHIYNLDYDQITWRRWCIANNCGGDINKFNQEYPACPEDAFIASGNCFFDLQKVHTRLKELDNPIKRGYFDYEYDYEPKLRDMTIKDIKWIDDPSGEIYIYEEPKEFYPYVTGGDTAGDGSDKSVLQVLDNTTGKQVCKFSSAMDGDMFAKQCFAIGMYYNKALLNIETNYDAGIISNLVKWGYPNIYRREVYDKMSQQSEDRFGFRTTTVTRPIILSRIREVVRDNPHLIYDSETLNEMQVFCLNSTGKKYQAQDGQHDDHVMSFAIAWESYSSNQMSHSLIYGNKKEKSKNWLQTNMEADKRKQQRRSKFW